MKTIKRYAKAVWRKMKPKYDLAGTTFHWQSLDTGEIVRDFPEVIYEIIDNRLFFGFWDFNWKYSKEGW